MSDANSAVMDLRRRDARDKLLGRTRYTIDRYSPGMLHAAVLRATVPSGRILRLDVTKAAAMPGVRAVVTAADAPGRIGIGIADHPLFAQDVVRYDGEPIAAVAAETIEEARAALAAIEVEIAPLPACITMADALAPDAPSSTPIGKATKSSSMAVGAVATSPGRRRSSAAMSTAPSRGRTP
ncbi:hypothetical protein [Segnochrobactrum spirostomi]|uniref:hypothetical protein n=1 Tax=Segnochrobactrum spirostomi TaxID=2608987 RepID=UPI001FE5292D|nr:hypothetical protein [Segnochrobactrum spirostomi]